MKDKEKAIEEEKKETKPRLSNSLKGKFGGENNPMYCRRGNKSPGFGTHWYNNGIITIKCKEEDCPEGFIRGRLYRKKVIKNIE